MRKLAEEKLSARCGVWRRVSGTVDTAIQGTTFIVDVEFAVRQAWREDLAPAPLRGKLVSLCVDFAPYLRKLQSFLMLLQEVPQFAVIFSQRAMASITSSLRLPTSNSAIDSGGFLGQKTQNETSGISSFSSASLESDNEFGTLSRGRRKSCAISAPRKRVMGQRPPWRERQN